MIRTQQRHALPRSRRKPLSERELQRLLRRLGERERELHEKIADERQKVENEELSQLENVVGDDVDRAFVKTQVGLERDLLDRYLGQLNEIAAAHDRIARGDIGICVDCGDPIESARLEANPVASRCTDCQARREQRERVVLR
jgi:DnaK suppressor protein